MSAERIKLFAKRLGRVMILNFLIFTFYSCEKELMDPGAETLDTGLELNDKVKNNNHDSFYQFDGAVYDIAAAPDGSIMVGVNKGSERMIQQVKNGKVSNMITFETATDLHGIAPLGAGNAFVTTGGSDRAQDGELYRVAKGNARMVADLADFEYHNDPDALEGNMWKNQLCEAIDGFTAGPQNNPFKVIAVNGGKALVADAAGNTILSATTGGKIDWMAIITPPVDENGDYLVRWTADDNGTPIPCYVQPVPTSIVEGPDGYVYVGELTGALADGLPLNLSRVWKIPADANNVVCEVDSGPCEVIIDGLTSVIDMAIGPDGLLYVVEFDQMSWLASFIPDLAAGGTISRYELDGTLVDVLPLELSFPSAITFDKNGNLWLLENNAIALPGYLPTVRMIEY